MQYQTTMTSKGQITLPAAFRHKMKLVPGQRITLHAKDDTLIIEAPVDEAELLRETAQHLARQHTRPLTDEELDDAIDDAAARSAVERYMRSFE